MTQRTLILGLLLCLAPAVCLPRQGRGDPAHPPGAGWPGGDRGPALVQVYTDADLARLSGLVTDIVSVRRGWAEVRLTDDERERLSVEGFSAFPIPDRALEEFRQRLAAGEIGGDAADAYYTLATLAADLQAVAAAHPDICRLYSAGTSVQGRPLHVMKITANPDAVALKPGFRYIGSMHGNEPLGMEMLMRLIHLLAEGYGSDSRITRLVDQMEIFVLPLMNPDGYGGFASPQRYNAHGVDLNRNFPDRIDDPVNTPDGREPETAAVMTWFDSRPTVMSANFHTGALVVNYPWDSTTKPSGSYAACPDDDTFIHISEAYACHNPPMWNSSEFHHGITNGCDWYILFGGLQDWSYNWTGDLAVTIELSDTFFPPASTLQTYWDNNRESLLCYMEEALKGVWGVVTDAGTGQPLAADITAFGRNVPFRSDPVTGDYYRRLLPGTYALTFEAEGYAPLTVNDVVITEGAPVRLDVQLSLHTGPTEGDVNDDGLIDALDLATLAAFEAGNLLKSDIDWREADLDHNNRVDVRDTLLLLLSLT
ncbi:MAG: carboxypeptidase regulatory-like domain-containing protein [Acidobacteria bacterium]|nr:carboxypeptidase regulatory-like domain-containing protein [Acidobacteriota bacterium]